MYGPQCKSTENCDTPKEKKKKSRQFPDVIRKLFSRIVEKLPKCLVGPDSVENAVGDVVDNDVDGGL